MRPIHLLILLIAVFSISFYTSYNWKRSDGVHHWEEQKIELVRSLVTPKSGPQPKPFGRSGSKMRDYQIELHMDTVWIFDGEREVGRFTNTTWDSKYDSMFLKDNQ